MTDNGPGGEALARQDLTTFSGSTKPGGMGLGILLCARLAILWGGRLEARMLVRDGEAEKQLRFTLPLRPRLGSGDLSTALLSQSVSS